MLEHAQLLTDWLSDEETALRAFRKHSSWYTKCFPGSAPLRQRLMQVSTMSELKTSLAMLDRDLPYPPEAMRVPRGKTAGTQRVALPEGYLDDPDGLAPAGADADMCEDGG